MSRLTSGAGFMGFCYFILIHFSFVAAASLFAFFFLSFYFTPWSLLLASLLIKRHKSAIARRRNRSAMARN
jgi:hypothetical protein